MINLYDDHYEATYLPSGSPLFDQIDELYPESTFDASFIPHIKWGPWEDVHIVDTVYAEHYDGYMHTKVLVQFKWDEWEFQIEAYRIAHDCPTCQCVDDVNEQVLEQLEEIEYEQNLLRY